MIRDDKFKEIDDLFAKLEQDQSQVEDIYDKFDQETPDLITLKESDLHRSTTVRRPEVPSITNESFERRIDYFLYMLKGVNYGAENSQIYVRGHLKALNRYIKKAQFNAKNLLVVEASVSKEITEYSRKPKNDIETKGYYDGLNYVYKALRLSKEAMALKINKILKRELGEYGK